MTINIRITESPWAFEVGCKIYGTTPDELRMIERFGLRNGGWGGAQLVMKTGRTELEQAIYDVCRWAHNNNKSLMIKRVISI